MDIETFKTILGDAALTDAQLDIVLDRAKRKAINHYWWKSDDIPTEEEIDNFVERYEYEIYDLAKTVIEVSQRQGLKQFSELGVTRVWETGGDKAIEAAISQIPVKTYIW